MDERQQKGLVIAATSKIVQKGVGTWIVPSQSANGKYAVTGDGDERECTCPDFELRRKPCKHVIAVQFVLFRESVTETKPDGTVVVTETETQAVRVTYSQPNWAAYNRAQVSEKESFVRLMRELVADIPEPARESRRGRPSLPLAEMLFAAAYKVYSGVSARRFMTDMREAMAAGHVSHAPHFNSILNTIESEAITPILNELITRSAMPLRALETQFAVDSTGFGTQCFYRHYSAKYGKDRERRDFVKLHAIVGTKTNVIAACRVTENNGNDSPELIPLVREAAENFDVREVSADKAYSGYNNLEYIESIGATPFVPFKINAAAVTKSKGRKPSKTWTRLFHFFHLNRDEFLSHYHRRSNVETTFSMIKRKLGDTLRAKTRTAQVNELLLKVVCHNIICLIHEMHELGIDPSLESVVNPAPCAALAG